MQSTIVRVTAALLVAAGVAMMAASSGAREAVAASVRIGAPGDAFFGGRLSAAEISRSLRVGPQRPGTESPELEEPLRGLSLRSPSSAQTASAQSPLPSASWQATTGGDPANKIKGTPAFSGGAPADPQIAVSSKAVVVGANDRLYFYTKNGWPYPSGKNSLVLSGKGGLFQPLIDTTLASGPKLGLPEKGSIDNFNDLRVIFDPFRKRFWVAATGTCRSLADSNGDGIADAKCALTLPENQRRMVVGLAVSADEDPSHGWYLYWWDAAVGWGSKNAAYVPGDLGDYPSLGVNATTVDVSVIVIGTSGTKKTGRAYPHVALYRADDMAAGVGPTIDGWHLYPLYNADGTCKGTGLTIPGGACPDSLIQPTLAHPDPNGSYLVSSYPGQASSLVVWKVTDLLQPTQQVKGDVVQLPFSWNTPNPSPQKGGASSNTIDMSIGHPGVPLKSVWAWNALFLVVPDADSAGRATFRILRLPTPGDFSPFDLPDPPNGGARQVNAGSTSTQSFGWPAIEVNKDGAAVIVYTVVGSSYYASIRYNAWLDVHPAFEPQMQTGRFLKLGEATLPQSKDGDGNPAPTRWGDLTGASVDFEGGKEAPGIWILHEYAASSGGGSTTNGTRAMWVGKIFGKALGGSP
jgi:hypothetical protein